MDAFKFLFLTKEVWEQIDIITIIAISGFLGTLITSFIVWQTDRPRLKQLEVDRDKMKADFEQHKTENTITFEKIRDSIDESNQKVVDKIDELKWYLLNSKITEKGQNEQRTDT